MSDHEEEIERVEDVTEYANNLVTSKEEAVKASIVDEINAGIEAQLGAAPREPDDKVATLAKSQNISIAEAAKALEDGYNPTKDPSDPDFKSVREYNRYGEIIKEIKDMRESLRKQRDAIKNRDIAINTLVTKITEKDIQDKKTKLEDLTKRRAMAVADGDVEAFKQHDKDALSAYEDLVKSESDYKSQNVKPTEVEVVPEAQAFVNSNQDWWNKDLEKTQFSIDFIARIDQTFPDKSVSEKLSALNTALEKRYGVSKAVDKEVQANMARETAPPILGSDKTEVSKPKGLRRLTPDEAIAYHEFKKREPNCTVEKFLSYME